MPNIQKKEYVSEILEKFGAYPHFVIVGFEKTSHQRMEELRNKLRAVDDNLVPFFSVIKNSLFGVALNTHNNKTKTLNADEINEVADNTKGQSAVLFLTEDWISGIKTFSTFAKDEEGMIFRVGMIDGKVYLTDGLTKLAALPGKEELVVKIIRSLRSSQTRLVYGMQYNTMKLVHILRNAKVND